MPDEKFLDEDIDFIDEESISAVAPRPRNVNEVFRSKTQEALAKAAPVSVGLPDIGAALGRKNLGKDIFDLVTLPMGNTSLVENLASGQTTPKYEPLKASAFGRAIPDVIQGTLAELGLLGGMAVAPLTGPAAPVTPLAGAAAGSIGGSKLAEGLREYSPEFFGETQDNLTVGPAEIPTTAFNLAFDVGLPGLSMLKRPTVAGMRQSIASGLVRKFGEPATEEMIKARQVITNPANEIHFSPDELPQPTVASTSGSGLRNFENIVAGEGLERIVKLNEQKYRTALMKAGGLTEEQLNGLAIPGGLSQEVSKLPERRGAIRAPSGPGVKDPSTVRGLQILGSAGQYEQQLKDYATTKYQYVRDTLASQGDTTLNIQGSTRKNLENIYQEVREYADNPDLSSTFGNLAATLENILGIPKTEVKVGTETKTTSFKITEKLSGKKPSKTTEIGEATVKNVPEGVQKESNKQVYGTEGDLAKTVQAGSLKTPLESAIENSVPTAIDYNQLVQLNSELKKTVRSTRAGTVPYDKSKVSAVTREIDDAIKEGLLAKPNGQSMANAHERGSALTGLRYGRFTEEMSNIMRNEETKLFDKIVDDPAVAQAFIKASKNRKVVQEDIWSKLIQRSYDADGNFSPKKALNYWQKPGIREAYTPKQYNSIEQFLKYTSGVTPDPSHIGTFAAQFRGANLVLNGLGALSFTGAGSALGGAVGAAKGAALWFGGRDFFRRIMLDPKAAEIATQLVKIPAGSPRAASYFRRLMPYVQGLKVTVNAGNQSFETTIDSDILNKLKFANRQAPNQAHDLINQVQQVAPAQQ